MEKGFLLLKPKPLANSDKIARCISKLGGVREVFVTSGEFAFVVNVEKDLKKIERCVSKLSKISKVSMAIRHYSYRK